MAIAVGIMFGASVAGATTPVVYDANSAPAAVNDSTLTWSHTIGADADRYLVAAAFCGGTAATPTSVTFDGAGMTLLGVATNGIGRQSVYGLADPTSGAHDVVVTYAAPCGNIIAGGVSFSNVAGPRTIETGTAASIDVTDATENDVVVDACGSDNTPTVGAGQTQRWNTAGSYAAAGSTEPGAAGTVTMSWTDCTSARHVAFALAPPETAGGPAALCDPCTEVDIVTGLAIISDELHGLSGFLFGLAVFVVGILTVQVVAVLALVRRG